MSGQVRSGQVRSGQGHILLVALCGNYNIGNRVQHYALQEVIKNLGFEVDNLFHFDEIYPKKLTVAQRVKKIIKYMLASLGIKKFKLSLISERNFLDRTEIFNEFNDKYINNKIPVDINKIINSDSVQYNNNNYNFVVTGSDQIWSPLYSGKKMLQYFLLEFVEPNKRVNYAPSFGVTKISDERYNEYKEGLSGFKKLSCREQSGCDLMREQFNLNSELVLDPTLLLNPEQWRKISRKPNFKIPEKYILVYSLDKLSDHYKNLLEKFAAGREIINIHDPSDLEHFLTGPQEFIYLIDHADGIFTDSFHGTAFSINFNKNFIVLGKEKNHGRNFMFDRMNTILTRLNLSDRAEAGKNFPPNEINYNDVNQKLNLMRESSLKYLRECLNVK